MEINLPTLKKVKSKVEELFQFIYPDAEIATRVADGIVFIDVTTHDQEDQRFSHDRGDTVFSLQLLLSLILQKSLEESVQIVLDVNKFRERREKALLQLAKRVVAQVTATGEEYVLEPMRPFERRIIHMFFQEYDTIETFSIGEDPHRQVVVKRK